MSLKIKAIDVENYEKIKHVHFEPDETGLIRICGKNAQGKTSLLNAIQNALTGRDAPEVPLRRGATKGFARVTLDNGLVIEKKITAKGEYLSVTAADGVKFSSPQAMLDKLVSPLTFDPLAFTRLAPKEQAAQLRKLAGIDTAAQDAEKDRIFNLRTQVNRDVARLAAQVAGAKFHPDAQKTEQSIADLTAELKRRQAVNAAADAAERAHVTAVNDCFRVAKDAEKAVGFAKDGHDRALGAVENQAKLVAKLETELNQARQTLENYKMVCTERMQAIAKYQEAADKAAEIAKAKQDDKPNVTREDADEITSRMQTVEADNAKFRANFARANIVAEHKKAEEESASLTRQIEAIEEAKRSSLQAAKFPVAGLGLDDQAGVTFNGIPFSQASGAEQLRVATAVELAINPNLRCPLLRDGSLLDEDGMALVAQMAIDANAQIFIERCQVEKDASIIIHDGVAVTAPAQGALL